MMTSPYTGFYILVVFLGCGPYLTHFFRKQNHAMYGLRGKEGSSARIKEYRGLVFLLSKRKSEKPPKESRKSKMDLATMFAGVVLTESKLDLAYTFLPRALPVKSSFHCFVFLIHWFNLMHLQAKGNFEMINTHNAENSSGSSGTFSHFPHVASLWKGSCIWVIHLLKSYWEIIFSSFFLKKYVLAYSLDMYSVQNCHNKAQYRMTQVTGIAPPAVLAVFGPLELLYFNFSSANTVHWPENLLLARWDLKKNDSPS